MEEHFRISMMPAWERFIKDQSRARRIPTARFHVVSIVTELRARGPACSDLLQFLEKTSVRCIVGAVCCKVVLAGPKTA